ncbi:Rhodanese-like protein [Trametes versicolor FP-101664 SS1]|uniref:Rhodanese-like protein n=1 Tax=Trametes versicolor (strain FP-101664) TaxID=717944 RepID=UPI0004621504|nr:Rhodanese-like protein [Trametes versicolor FP-101664 SS1]EIW64883.1 Rhodanese-like protein [Trametes versicolor FP-101664 SS1]
MLTQTFVRRSLSLTKNLRLRVRSYATMFGDYAPLVITPAQLHDQLKAKPADGTDIVVLDASWHMPNSPRKGAEEFPRAHLPSARFIDIDAVSTPHPFVPHMMPDPATFASACARLGISPETHVVLYDTHGVFSSPRALYMFRAFGHHRSSILDGGLPGWQAHGGVTEDGQASAVASQPEYPPTTLRKDIVKDYGQIVSNSKLDPAKEADAFYVLDARAKDRFLGKAPEPRPGLRSGHMPYAVSLPFNAFLETHTVPEHIASKVLKPSGQDGPYTYTRLRSNQGILTALEESLGPERTEEVLQGKRQVVTTCGSGMTASVLWLGLKLLGVERLGLYDESWLGYATRPESEVVQGE